jgi:hypothetical protein
LPWTSRHSLVTAREASDSPATWSSSAASASWALDALGVVAGMPVVMMDEGDETEEIPRNLLRAAIGTKMRVEGQLVT